MQLQQDNGFYVLTKNLALNFHKPAFCEQNYHLEMQYMIKKEEFTRSGSP